MNKTGKKDREEEELETRAKEMVKRLQEHPGLLERVEALLDIAQAPQREGEAGMDVNAIEDRVVNEVRRLGQQTMEQWAQHAQEQVTQEVESGTERGPRGAKVRKKRG